MGDIYSTTMLISIIIFSFSSFITPGPNNIMLLSSGLSFGYKKTIPHMLGVILGFPLMIFAIGIGLNVVFERYPFIYTLLKIVGSIYLFWMAYKIAYNKGKYSIDNTNEKNKPFSFIQIVFFQWVNPKAWIMSVTTISIFISSNENSFYQLLIICFTHVLIGVISTNTWVLGGVFLKKFIHDEKNIGIFNKTMALLLIISIVPFLFE